jgi:hypothetical protein
MKRALLALAMVSVSVPLRFAKTNNHATRRWTPSPGQATFDIQTQRKARGQHREPPERSDTRRCPQNPGI